MRIIPIICFVAVSIYSQFIYAQANLDFRHRCSVSSKSVQISAVFMNAAKDEHDIIYVNTSCSLVKPIGCKSSFLNISNAGEEITFSPWNPSSSRFVQIEPFRTVKAKDGDSWLILPLATNNTLNIKNGGDMMVFEISGVLVPGITNYVGVCPTKQ